MTPQQIQEAYARASEVLNGFKNPSQRNAQDVVNLVKHISNMQTADIRDSRNKNDNLQAVKDLFGL